MTEEATKLKIIDELSHLASSYSFGRILGYIQFNETLSQKESLISYAQKDWRDRLNNNEIIFLSGLWVSKFSLENKGWNINEDDDIVKKVYILMSDLHNTYHPEQESLIGNRIKEIIFYEGDAAYAEQMVDTISLKYNDSKQYILEKKNIDICRISYCYYKIKKFIENQINKRRREKRKKREYFSPMNAFTISRNSFLKKFSEMEQTIIESFSIPLGMDFGFNLNDIGDENPIRRTPIIKLPTGGYFISNFNVLASAFNEAPYNWLKEDKEYSKGKLANERGRTAEEITYKLLQKVVPKEFLYRNTIIRRNRVNTITDIDILFKYNKTAIVFQIKSKGLTILAKSGKYDIIYQDFTKAVIDAYDQGVKCVSCLKNYSEYMGLENISDLDKINYYCVVCVVLETFPSITSLSYYFAEEIEKKNLSLIALSLYDLEIIVSLLAIPSKIVDYFIFRNNLSKQKYYAVNEMDFLGAYLEWRKLGKFKHNGLKVDGLYSALIDEWYYANKKI